VELGGRSAFTLAEYLAMLRQLGGGRRARVLPLSARNAAVLARVCDLLHLTPFGAATRSLLLHEKVPAYNALRRLLVRPAHGIGSALVISSGWAQTREAISPVGYFES
jgi:hypothetical protein